jgi:hypothetical protein
MAETRSPQRPDDEAGPDRGSLFGILYAPVIWALHFLFIYVFAAITCAKSPQWLGDAAIWIGVATGLALLGIVTVTTPAFLEWLRERRRDTDMDDPEGRAHFLAHAALLLAGLSAFATVLQALPALLSASCR